MQRHDQHFLHMGLLSHDNKQHNICTYISYASLEQTRQDRYQETLEAAGDKCQRIKKVTNVNENKQCMEGGLQEEPVEYGVSMPSPQFTQQAASIGTSPMPIKCFHHVLLL